MLRFRDLAEGVLGHGTSMRMSGRHKKLKGIRGSFFFFNLQLDFLLHTVELLCLQSVEVLLRHTLPL